MRDDPLSTDGLPPHLPSCQAIDRNAPLRLDEQQTARTMRSRGFSVGEIATRLKRPREMIRGVP